jgi:hypothetical protein
MVMIRANKAAVYYPQHEGAQFIVNGLHEENSTALPTSSMLNVKYRMLSH